MLPFYYLLSTLVKSMVMTERHAGLQRSTIMLSSGQQTAEAVVFHW